MSAQHSPRYVQLMATQEQVFADWLAQVRAAIPYASGIPRPALINTLPLFFEHLVRATTGESKPYDHSALAAEHGGQRARVTRFNAGSIVHEFQLFRSAILGAWHRAGISLALDEVERLNNAIDEALRESLTGFSVSQVQIREQFFMALAHDLRTPLAAASAAVQLIGVATSLARVQQMAAIATRQQATLNTMICNLLDMMVFNAGAAAFEVTDTEVVELVSEAVASVTLSSGRTMRLAGEPIHGKWHAVAIRRAIENLLNNAVKYSDRDTPIDIVVAAQDGMATIAVTNTGPPIPAEQTEAIFQLFQRAPGDREKGIAGWGIGLPYVRTVAEQHGGRVTVESDDTRTTFLFALPLDRIDDTDEQPEATGRAP